MYVCILTSSFTIAWCIIALMHICLFGGAFDPPHLGHVQISRAIISEKVADEVWFLPVKNHHFEKKMNDIKHRLKMLEMIVPQNAHMRIELYETKQQGINYTYQTMVALSKQYPVHQFSFVIGSDNLVGYDRWLVQHPQLLDFPFFVYPREGFPFEPMYSNMTALNGFKTVAISSTQVREKVAKGESISGLVDPQVEQYIKENKLYI